MRLYKYQNLGCREEKTLWILPAINTNGIISVIK